MSIFRLLLSAFVVSGLALSMSPVSASEPTAEPGATVVSLDPESTDITFDLSAGRIELGPDGRASGRLEIQAGSAETGSNRRDKTMHAKVLESTEHPLISFVPESFDGELPADGKGTLKLHGTLSLLERPHPMTLEIEVKIDGDRYTGTSHFDVPFVEWGLPDPSVLFLRVEKVVRVNVESRGELEHARAASATVAPDPASTDPVNATSGRR